MASSTALSCLSNSSRRELAFLAALAAAAATLALVSEIGDDSKGRFLPAIVALRSIFLGGGILFCGLRLSLTNWGFKFIIFAASLFLDDSLRVEGEIFFLRLTSIDDDDE